MTEIEDGLLVTIDDGDGSELCEGLKGISGLALSRLLAPNKFPFKGCNLLKKGESTAAAVDWIKSIRAPSFGVIGLDWPTGAGGDPCQDRASRFFGSSFKTALQNISKGNTNNWVLLLNYLSHSHHK